MKNRFKSTGSCLIFLALIAVLISGCATVPRQPPPDPRMDIVGSGGWLIVQTNSLAAPDAPSKGKTYFITSAMKDVSDIDLQFIEFARYIENALSQKGYTRVKSKEKADQLIRLAYGIGAPSTSTQTYTTSTGYSYPVGYMWFTVPPRTQTVKETSYMRNLILESYDLKDPKGQAQLWKTTLQSEGDLNDLRLVLAYMIAASADHFGTNTGQLVRVNINGYDPRVLKIWK